MPFTLLKNGCKRLKQEFQTSKLSLTHRSPSQFYTSEWHRLRNWKFWIIRFVIVGYFTLSFITSVSYSTSRGKMGKWIVFLTSFNHILVTLYAFSCLAMVVRGMRQVHSEVEYGADRRMDSSAFTRFAKVHWLLFNTSAVVCSFVFGAYWILIFPTDADVRSGDRPLAAFLTIDRHGINLLLLVIDFFLSCTPVRLLHFIYPSCALGLFFVYNGIYWASTGDLIYGEVLNYGSNTGKAVTMVFMAVLVVSPIIQLLWLCLFLLRTKLAAKNEHETELSYQLAEGTTQSQL